MEAKVMSRYDPGTAKRIYVYRNGAINTDAKQLVVNDRQVRDFGTFLNRVTSGLRAPVAIRNIYTPSEGHKVRTLGDLQSGHYYVAGGAEHFKKARYGAEPKLLQRRPARVEVSIPARTQQAVVASARYKRPVEKPFVIHVFRNGDERFKGVRVLLPRRIMGSWEHVLEVITEKTELFTPAKRLCTLDGRTVHAVSELQDGSKYVAMEGSKPFKKVAYCATVDTSPLLKRRLYRVPRIRRRVKKLRHQATSQPPEDRPDDQQPPRPPPEVLLQRRKSRPMAGRKNKEAREQAIIDHRADSVFGGSPTRQMLGGRTPSPPGSSLLHASINRPRDPALKPQNPTYKPRDPTHKPLDSTHKPQDSFISKSQDRNASLGAPSTLTTTAAIAVAPPTLPVEEPTRSPPKETAEQRHSASRGGSTSDELSTSSRCSRTRGVFQAPSQPTLAGTPQSEYVEGEQGEAVFKAKLQRSEIQGAEDVQESKDIEVEQPVDQEEAREVEEEKGEGPGAEPQEATPHQAAVKQLSQELELESQPLQTSVGLSMKRVQPMAASTASHTPSRASGELTEAAHSRAGSPERAVPKEGERGSPPRPGNSGGTPLKEELAEDPVPEEEIEPVPEEAVDPVPEQEAESVPEEEVDPVPEQEVEPVPEEGEDPTPRASRSSQLQPAASKTTSRQESQEQAADDPQPVNEEVEEETRSQHSGSGENASLAGSGRRGQGEELGESDGHRRDSRSSPEQTFVVEDS